MTRIPLHDRIIQTGNKYETKISIIQFRDQNLVCIYAPAFDVVAAGRTVKEAHESFQITFEAFFEYAIAEDTLNTELRKLGWTKRPNRRNGIMFNPPTVSKLIQTNETYREILAKDTYSKSTQTRELAY